MSTRNQTASRPGVHVALLRGINVGGKNKLSMKALAAMFVELGCADVRTYIQSGNVVFTATAALARRVPERIAAAIDERFDLTVPVVVRTAGDLRRVTRENPFVAAGADGRELHVAFLADRPAASRVARLDPERSPPDEFAVKGREIYLRCPNGVGRSKLTTTWFDSVLATTSTVRNWNTVTKLLGLASG